MVHQFPAEGGGDIDDVLVGIRFPLTHDRVGDLFSFQIVHQGNLGAESDFRSVDHVRGDDRGPIDLFGKPAEIVLNQSLFFLSVLILAVLPQIAHLAGCTDLPGDFRQFNVLDIIQLLLFRLQRSRGTEQSGGNERFALGDRASSKNLKPGI